MDHSYINNPAGYPARTFGSGDMVRRFGSLRLTPWLLILLALGVVSHHLHAGAGEWPLSIALALLAANLLTSVATHSSFRRHASLLVFHIALLIVISLAAIGRLTYLKGHVELSEGAAFSGRLAEFESGPLHAWGLNESRFINRGFTIYYDKGIRRAETENQVAWIDQHGQRQQTTIGDHQPLVLNGYRFYTTHNKGFAPTFTWIPGNGSAPVTGTIHLPSYPMREFRQARKWTMPGTDLELWAMLVLEERVIDAKQAFQFRIPERHHLIIRIGEDRHVLRSGERLPLANGEMIYHGLKSWMGYRVHYDWTRPWILAACLLGICALAWHYAAKHLHQPWLSEGTAD